MSARNNHYILALDDTGDTSPLLDLSLQPSAPVKHQPMGLGAFVLREDYEEEFRSDWLQLRQSLQRELGLQAPPPIHLRLMYGKRLRPEMRKGVPNPYFVPTVEEAEARFPVILEHLRRGSDLIAKYTNRKRTAAVYLMLRQRDELVETTYRMYSQPEPKADFAKFRQRDRRAYNAFVREVTRPLLQPVVRGWLFFDEMVRDAGGESANVLFDKFAGTEQLVTKQMHATLQAAGELHRLEPHALCHDSDEDALIQAADLIVYLEQRIRNGDSNARSCIAPKIGRLTAATYDVLMDRVDRGRRYRDVLMHYAVARAAAERASAAFVNSELRTIDEFKHALDSTPAGTTYTSMFK